MPSIRAISGLVLAAAVAAGCAASPTDATRTVTLDDTVFGYTQYEGASLRFPEFSTVSGGGNGVGFRSGLVITILTRDGVPVDANDRAAARAAARVICEDTNRRWYDRDRGDFLESGGISFAGACG
ncbi:MAG: hypothetical protein HLUCCA12_03345 [Rhodobacteraceae bacterium HLUCCA12]|nr:MAG: hypothetical protein HLUCCA12_03345 [Rhodobacteraceae bacterium HLUCCA12]